MNGLYSGLESGLHLGQYTSTYGLENGIFQEEYNTDPHAIIYLQAALTCSKTEAVALHNYIRFLKSIKVWDKIKVLYLYLGSTLNSARINIKDINRFKGSLTGAGGNTTFSSRGMLTTINSVFNTGFAPSSNLTINNICYGVYLRNTIPNGGVGNVTAFGSFDGSNLTSIYPRNNTSNVVLMDQYSSTTGRISGDIDANAGIFLSNRQASNNFKGWINGNLLGSISTSGGAINSLSLYVGSLNNNGNILQPLNNGTNSIDIGLFMAADSFTDTECVLFSHGTIFFQRVLGRVIV
jgi:hypothetical protein